MIRVYYFPRSRAQRVLWTCEELGLPYQAVPITRQAKQEAEHLARHPLGRIPVLELSDGTHLFESAAICLYLAERHGQLLPPAGSVERGLAYQWLFFAMTELEPPLFQTASARRAGADDQSAFDRFTQAARVVAQRLDRHPWLVADAFSVVDIIAARVLGIAVDSDLLGGNLGALRDYVLRARARAAAQRALAVADQAWRDAGLE
jgi:glutathione S-transferase